MYQRVKAYVEEQHMLEKKDRVIVGVSGGADSVCGQAAPFQPAHTGAKRPFRRRQRTVHGPLRPRSVPGQKRKEPGPAGRADRRQQARVFPGRRRACRKFCKRMHHRTQNLFHVR